MLKDAGFKEVIAEERTDRVSIKSHRFQSLYIILVIWVITNLVFMYHYSFWMCCKGNWMLSRRTKTPSLKSSLKFVVFSFTTYFLCFSFFFFFSCILLCLSCYQNDYSEIVNGWKAKLKRSSVGEQRWGLFIAKKWWINHFETVNGWKAKLKRSSVGEQRLGLFIAKKWWINCFIVNNHFKLKLSSW